MGCFLVRSVAASLAYSGSYDRGFLFNGESQKPDMTIPQGERFVAVRRKSFNPHDTRQCLHEFRVGSTKRTRLTMPHET
jgi:hypothetical protein